MSSVPPPADRLPVRATFGRYDVLGRLAKGGHAETFLARRASAGGPPTAVVLKRLLPHVAAEPGFVNRFFDDARLTMRLKHPAIARVLDLGEETGSYYVATEWVDGVPLGALIAAAPHLGGLPAPVAVRIASSVAGALHAAHEVVDDEGRPMRVVHRDVSPQNVRLSWTGAVKVLEFGLARSDAPRERPGLGLVKGKFAYMSPEQCVGEVVVDGRSDVFSLGVLLWESLAGRPLFHRKNQYQTMSAVVYEEAPSLASLRPDVDEELDGIVRSALAKDRDRRLPSAGELERVLEAWLAKVRSPVPALEIAKILDAAFPGPARRLPRLDEAFLPPDAAGPSSPGQAYAPSVEGWGEGSPFARYVSSSGEVEAPAADSDMPPVATSFPPDHELSYLPPPPPGSGSYPSFEMLNPPDLDVPRVSSNPPREPARTPGLLLAALLIAGFGVAAFVMGRPPADSAEAPGDEGARESVPARATLSVDSRPPSKVMLGERVLGQTPVTDVEVPSGSLELQLLDAAGRHHDRELTLEAGEQRDVLFELR